MAVVGTLAVILLHWNQPERCARTVAAFRAGTVPVRITVVDNGSQPAARKLLGELLDDVPVLDIADNIGFGPGANVGIQDWLDDPRRGEWVVLAPHDVLPAPDCLERLGVAVACRPRAGLACADVGDGHVPVVDPYFGGMTVPAAGGDGWQPAGYPHGTLLFARRACLADIGLFDERYFAYCEEADLGERARRAGWEVGLVRGARVHNPHLGSATDVIDYLMLRNTLLFVRDHFGAYRAAVRVVIALLHVASGIARPASRPWIFRPRARLRAVADHLGGRYGPSPAPFR